MRGIAVRYDLLLYMSCPYDIYLDRDEKTFCKPEEATGWNIASELSLRMLESKDRWQTQTADEVLNLTSRPEPLAGWAAKVKFPPRACIESSVVCATLCI
jgi:hypothetical protein